MSQPAPPSPPLLVSEVAAQKVLLLDDQPIPYRLRRSAKRHSIGLKIDHQGLSVSAPMQVSMDEVQRSLLRKSSWILKHLKQVLLQEKQRELTRIEWGDHAHMPYLGKTLHLHTPSSSTSLPGTPQSPWPALTRPELLHDTDHTDRLYLRINWNATQGIALLRKLVGQWLMRQASHLFEQRLHHFAPQLGVRWQHLVLSNARTRWGSANSQGVIRLNWRLIHFAPEVIDYVVIHELAHLIEMNHSARFWQLVQNIMPDYEQHRAQLRNTLLPEWA